MKGWEDIFVARKKEIRFILSTFDIFELVIKICDVKMCILFCFVKLFVAMSLISIKTF